MIITAQLDPQSKALFDELRRTYFPADRNFLESHLTLFHNVPPELRGQLPALARPLDVRFTEPYSLGRGFAIEAICPELLTWRREVLRLPFAFTPQDQQVKRLHITLQNKVEPKQAKADLAAFRLRWSSFEGQILGLEYWRYLDGPWERMN